MTIDLIVKALSIAAKKDEPVQLFLDPDHPHHFVVALLSGSPVAGVVVFMKLSPSKQPDGVCVWKLGSIVRVGLNTEYLSPFRSLTSTASIGGGQLPPPITIKRTGLPTAFRGKAGIRRVVTLQTGMVENEPFTIRGRLVALDRRCICVAQLDSDGNEDGLMICRRKYIDAINSHPQIMRRPRIPGAP